ncbi:hypothetical protein HPP92_017766 [Vanilla planifolia]|uniref:Protein kinase domain-containing protein n=1 Tax=Vanilla planifolia TaxID=51239 RepID=A0A835QGQ6_VANPL|nr:hypothetical protein HPP92_017766 [Vanilla planifolia]
MRQADEFSDRRKKCGVPANSNITLFASKDDCLPAFPFFLRSLLSPFELVFISPHKHGVDKLKGEVLRSWKRRVKEVTWKGEDIYQGVGEVILDQLKKVHFYHQFKLSYGFLNVNKPMKASLVVLISSIIILLNVIILIAVMWMLKKCITFMKRQKTHKVSTEAPGVSATGNFQPKNQLGSGGFGPVYQGTLDDGRRIAVKRLILGNSGQGEKEFLAEVRMLTSIQHRNLVRLIGCCSIGSQRLLVYEFMINRSLDHFLFENNELFLDWKMRFNIILGIARGLQYLHEGSNFRILHRDIKASNILLDEGFQPKISDFGLARLFPEDDVYVSTHIAGTLGYTAPEYALKGELSEKADIYSFGVLILEIISNRMNTDLSLPPLMQYLPEYAWKLYERSSICDLVNPRLKADGIDEAGVLQVCQVALLCLQPCPSLRPSMSEVVSMLTSKTVQIASPEKPAFMDAKYKINTDIILPLSCERESEFCPSTESDSLTSTPRFSVKSSVQIDSGRFSHRNDINGMVN